MPCDTRIKQQPNGAEILRAATERLERLLASGNVSAIVSQSGAIAFRGWKEEDRRGLSDLCAYRQLLATNSPALRRAVARAEAIAGRKLDARQVAAGVHSHDGGQTFHKGHGFARLGLVLALALAAALLLSGAALAHPGHGGGKHCHPESSAPRC